MFVPKMTKNFFTHEAAVRVGGANSKMADPHTGKMGVLYVALQAVRTCGKDLPCYRGCYAIKEERVYTSAHRCYARNTDIALSDPETYFGTIRAAIRFYGLPRFRWHTGGDIPSISYFREMRKIALEFPGVRFLAFTKRYEIVNFSIAVDGDLPDNLVVVFSDWGGGTVPTRTISRLPMSDSGTGVTPISRRIATRVLAIAQRVPGGRAVSISAMAKQWR